MSERGDFPLVPRQTITVLASEVRYLVIARILGPIGVEGEIRARILTDFSEHFLTLATVHVGDNLRPFFLDSARIEAGTVALKLRGINDAAAAKAMRNQEIQIPVGEAVTLPPDQFYWHQIVGLTAWTDEGRHLGDVDEVLRTGSNDVYVVGQGSKELLIPAIEDVVLRIDLDRRIMIVHLIPGLGDNVT